MPSEKSWKTVEEVATKFRLETSLLLKWAEYGVIRSKQADTRSMRVNAADLENKMRSITGTRVTL